MSKHTPIPWQTRKTLRGVAIESCKKHIDCDCKDQNHFKYSLVANVSEFVKNHEANAALIVKAVNNHDKLVALLEEIDSKTGKTVAMPTELWGKLKTVIDEVKQ